MSTQSTVKTISVQTLKQLYDTDPSLCLIDVRELDEWNQQHIPNAHHIPKDTLLTVIKNKVPDLSQPIYLHCQGGVRSLFSAEDLCKLGYKSVYSVDGGIIAWSNANYPTQSA